MSSPANPLTLQTSLRHPLTLTNVTLQYPDGDGITTALDAVDLSVQAGQMMALVGPSGSGKSSLLAVAATLVRPTHGVITIDGTDATGLSDKEMTTLRREKIGIIFQQPNLLASLTAVEQLILADHLRGANIKESRVKALERLDVVGLAGSVDKRPHQLSGGQRQRVNIARALMGDPKVLLVDEPTAALDHERSNSIVRLLRQVTDDFAVATIMVTHDLEFVPLADAVATMRDGRLGDPAAAAAAPSRHGAMDLS